MRRLVITLAALSIAGISLALWVRWERGLDPVERGKHLVRVVGCNDCHTPTIKGPGGLPIPDTSRLLSGHPEGAPYPTWTPSDLRERNIGAAAGPLRTVWAGPWGVAFTANLTPDTETGIGNWTEEMFIQTIRTGKHQGQDTGRAILPPMPLANLNHPAYGISDDDLKDIWAYLRSLPPVSNRVPPPIAPRPGTSGRGVSERDGRSDQPRERRRAIPMVAKMTAVDVLGRVDELTDGTGGSVDAVMGATMLLILLRGGS